MGLRGFRHRGLADHDAGRNTGRDQSGTPGPGNRDATTGSAAVQKIVDRPRNGRGQIKPTNDHDPAQFAALACAQCADDAWASTCCFDYRVAVVF